MRKAVFCVCTVVEHGDGDVQLFVCVRVCVCVCVSLYSAVWISATPAPRVATVPASAPTSSIPPRATPTTSWRVKRPRHPGIQRSTQSSTTRWLRVRWSIDPAAPICPYVPRGPVTRRRSGHFACPWSLRTRAKFARRDVGGARARPSGATWEARRAASSAKNPAPLIARTRPPSRAIPPVPSRRRRPRTSLPWCLRFPRWLIRWAHRRRVTWQSSPPRARRFARLSRPPCSSERCAKTR